MGALIKFLTEQDNQLRSIAGKLLANLVVYDPETRILKDFPTLYVITKDDRFVTARQCLQSIWKVGLAGTIIRKMALNALMGRFKECITEKNYSPVRYEIINGFRKKYGLIGDEKIRDSAIFFIEVEQDDK